MHINPVAILTSQQHEKHVKERDGQVYGVKSLRWQLVLLEASKDASHNAVRFIRLMHF
jgi:hypothetical protein